MRTSNLIQSILLLFIPVFVHSHTSEAAESPTATLSPSIDPYCNCAVDIRGHPIGWSHNKIWLDIVVIIDTSQAMGKEGLHEASDYIESFLNNGRDDVLNTNQSAPFYSRIGVISMSDTVEVLYNLNMTKMDKLTEKASIKEGVHEINVVDAFKAALKMFEDGLTTNPERLNTRQVIYYTTCADPKPNMNPVDQFKASKGVVIVNNHLKDGNSELRALENIASPGYYFSNRGNLFLLQAFCKANCFCEPDLTAYSGSDPAVKASGGCYHPNPARSTFNTAKHTCSNGGGILATIHDEEKGRFVKEIMAGEGVSHEFWIGLEREDDGEWKWAAQSNNTYTNWANKEPSQEKINKCAYANPKEPQIPWSAANCTVEIPFVCEFKPCSAGHKDCFDLVKKGANNINQN